MWKCGSVEMKLQVLDFAIGNCIGPKMSGFLQKNGNS
jgi:hypothetical protein